MQKLSKIEHSSTGSNSSSISGRGGNIGTTSVQSFRQHRPPVDQYGRNITEDTDQRDRSESGTRNHLR